LIAFTLIDGFGRAGVQLLGLIESGLAERVLPSLIWPFAMGAAIGVLFLALSDALRGLSGGVGAASRCDLRERARPSAGGVGRAILPS